MSGTVSKPKASLRAMSAVFQALAIGANVGAGVFSLSGNMYAAGNFAMAAFIFTFAVTFNTYRD